MAYIADRDKWTGMPVRYYRVTDEMVEMVLSVRAPGLPLDEGSRRVAMAASPRYAARCAERYGDPDATGGADVNGPDDDGPNDGPQDGSGVVEVDFTPPPPLDLTGPDIPLAEIVRRHRAMQGQGAAQPAAVAVLDSEPVVEEELPVPAPLRSVRERLAELPVGEEAIFGVLALRGRLGASTVELIDASGRKRSWVLQELARWRAQERIAQPDGKGGRYYLPEFAPSSGG